MQAIAPLPKLVAALRSRHCTRQGYDEGRRSEKAKSIGCHSIFRVRVNRLAWAARESALKSRCHLQSSVWSSAQRPPLIEFDPMPAHGSVWDSRCLAVECPRGGTITAVDRELFAPFVSSLACPSHKRQVHSGAFFNRRYGAPPPFKGGAYPYRDRGPAHPCWLNVTPALTA